METGESVTLEFGGGEVCFEAARAAERVALRDADGADGLRGHFSCEPLDLLAKAADLLDQGPLVAVGWGARMTETIEQPDPGYRYEFDRNELDTMSACLDLHGFAIIKEVLPDAIVAGLRKAVWDGTDLDRTLGPGESRTRHAWIESGPGAWSLLEHEPFMEIHRHLIGTDEMTVHRSAAIIRMPGSAPVRWHSDWQGFSEGPPKNSGEVLNRGLWPSGKWFYITGSRPAHGGLCVIEDSHVEGWEGPEGFSLTGDRRSFYPEGEEESSYDGFDIPGLIPLFTDPGDMIVFAHRTYHGAFPNELDEPRLSCAIGFRDRNHRIEIPWEIPERGRRFLAELPAHLQRYVDGYTSIDAAWRGE